MRMTMAPFVRESQGIMAERVRWGPPSFLAWNLHYRGSVLAPTMCPLLR